MSNHLYNALRDLDPTALKVIAGVLKARVQSQVTQTDNLEIRSDVRKGYEILSHLVTDVLDDVEPTDVMFANARA